MDLGEPPSREPLETEPAPTLGGGAPPAAATVTPRAVNALCPVAGKPIDPDVVVVLKGRAVGFCCTKCAGMFLADPAAYEGKIR